MAKTRYMYATAPDGTVVKRRTDNDYAYAVCTRHRGTWSAPSWSGSRANADKRANELRNFGYTVSVVPARETP